METFVTFAFYYMMAGLMTAITALVLLLIAVVVFEEVL